MKCRTVEDVVRMELEGRESGLHRSGCHTWTVKIPLLGIEGHGGGDGEASASASAADEEKLGVAR